MGYYADSTWDLTLMGDPDDFATDLKPFVPHYREPSDYSIDTVIAVLSKCNENTDITYDEDKATISGWGGGKCLSLADDNDFWSVVAKYCVGTVDWVGEDKTYSRLRLYGDGTFRDFLGEIVYPDDADDTFTP